MRRDLFLPTPEAEARLLLLISTFTTKGRGLEGRTKLAKLDFLLRYPEFLRRALLVRRVSAADANADNDDIEHRMVRFRFGPWDPAYFAILGALIGKRLVMPVPGRGGIDYRATEQGQALALKLAKSEAWSEIAARARILKAHFDWTGTNLKDFIYTNFPEVTAASWGQKL